MAGPWEQYQQASGPWEKYAQSAESPMPATDRFLQGLRDPIDAGAQMLVNALPDAVVEAGNKLNNWIAENTGLVGELPDGGVDQQIRENEAAYVKPEGVDWARMGGNVLSPANLAIASKIPAAASLAGRIGLGAAGGAAMGAMQPVTEGDFAKEKAKQVMTGAAFGGALPVATGAAARVINPKAATNPNVQLLRSEGVTPTIGQTLGGFANKAEQKLMSVPLLGDAIAAARGRANQGLERAAFNRALSPIGMKLPEGLAGRDAISFTEQALAQNYDDVLNRIGAIKIDKTFNMQVSGLRNMVNRMNAPKAEKQAFFAALDKINQSNTGGVITSDAYKNLESVLGKNAQTLKSAQDVFKNDIGDAVKQLQAELRSMLQRQAGQHSGDLSKANKAWANFKRVQRAAASLGAEEGSFSPAQLQNAIKALDKSKDKGAFSRGNALMQDLGDAGKSVLGNTVPNSGTAERLLLGGGALGSYLINPMMPLSIAGSSLLYTGPVQKALVGALASRPQAAQPVADLVRRSSPYFLPATQGLLNYE